MFLQVAAPVEGISWTTVIMGFIGLVSTLGMGWLTLLTQKAMREAAERDKKANEIATLTHTAVNTNYQVMQADLKMSREETRSLREEIKLFTALTAAAHSALPTPAPTLQVVTNGIPAPAPTPAEPHPGAVP